MTEWKRNSPASHEAVEDTRPDPASELETFFRISQDLLCIVGVDGYIQRTNPAFVQVLGLSEASLRGERLIEYVHPDDHAIALAELASLAGGTPSISFESRCRRLDGSYAWISWTSTADLSSGLIYSVGRDVTQRKRIEAQLELVHELSREISLSDDLMAALAMALRKTCEAGGWAYGEAWMVGAEGTTLELSTACYAETAPARQFRAASQQALDMKSSLVAHVWSTARPVWCADVTTAPAGYFRRADLANASGLHALLAVPVVSGRRVIAILVLLRHEPGAEDREQLELLTGVGVQLGDLLRRCQANQAVRESEARYELVARATNDAIYDRDLTSNVTRWSSGLQRLFGYTPDQVGSTIDWWLAQLHPDDADRIGTEVHDVVERGIAEWSGEYRFRGCDGRYVWIYDRALLLFHPDGAPARMIGSMMDITSRKQTECALRHREHQLAEAQALAQLGSWELDLVSFEVRWSDALYAINGVSPATFTPSYASFLEAIHPEDRARADTMVQQALRDVTPYRLEYRIVRPDGSVRHLIGHGDFTLEGGKPVRLFGSVQDVTTAAEARDALQRALADAQAATRAKSEFLANMSHEIRTPMNGIVGITELLLGTQLSREQREYLEIVRGSTDALLEVINSILDFSRLEARRVELDRTAFSLRESLADTLRSLAVRVESKGLELVWYVAPLVPDDLIGDVTKLRQILVNLIGNAIKFTTSGEIAIDVRCDEGGADDVILEIGVRDTGLGIPTAQQHAIFEPFTQGESSTTRTHGGSGLGLAISRSFVELMQGRLWVESAPGAGSTFRFTAHFARDRDANHATVVNKPGSAKPCRILVVDDHPVNRQLLSETLEGWQLAPSVADAGSSALELLANAEAARTPFELVLLDHRMPGMDGLELARRIRADRRFGAPTLVLLSSDLSSSTATAARALGIRSQLTTPIKLSELHRAVVSGVTTQPIPMPSPTTRQLHQGHRPLRVLVAEDNLVNQLVIDRSLAKLGHRVMVVGNGEEAVRVSAAETFDVILMDVQMPILDGLDATARIRHREATSGAPRVPIVALTAHAMAGDRERCLTAGMDAHVTKPMSVTQLMATITALVPDAVTVVEGHATQDREPTEPAFDLAAALARVGGDRGFLREMVALLQVEWPRMKAQIELGLRREDPVLVARSAHAARGMVANFQATAAMRAAEDLERLGLAGQLAQAGPALAALAGALDVLLVELATSCGQP